MSPIRSINPWNGEVLQEYSPASPAAVEQALALGAHCFETWRKQSFPEKSRLFYQLAQRLRAQKEELALLISLEVGKVITESRAEIEKCALVCDFYAERAAAFLAPEPIPLPDQKKRR